MTDHMKYDPRKYECPIHHGLHDRDEWCEKCLDWLETQPAANDMSGEERRAEMEYWGSFCLTIPFERLHARFEKLVGRPVWTHEMATSLFPGLIMEAAQPRAQDHDHTYISQQGEDVVAAKLEGMVGKDKVMRINLEDLLND